MARKGQTERTTVTVSQPTGTGQAVLNTSKPGPGRSLSNDKPELFQTGRGVCVRGTEDPVTLQLVPKTICPEFQD